MSCSAPMPMKALQVMTVNHHSTQTITSAVASNHPHVGLMSLADIATDDATIRASVAKFIWLCERLNTRGRRTVRNVEHARASAL